MSESQKPAGVWLTFAISAGIATMSQALGDEVSPNRAAAADSSSASASISATIVERPNFSCEQILGSVTVGTAAFPPLPGDQSQHLHPVATPQFGCYTLQGMFSFTTGNTPTEPAARQPALTAHNHVVPAGANSTALSGGTESSGHRHEVEVIYNFE